MKTKIFSTLMVVFAIALYTMAIVDFTQVKVMDGICNVLFACTDLLVAFVLIRTELLRNALIAMLKLHFDFMEQLEKGVPATLTIKKGDDEEISEDELTEDEKRVKRMAEEYDQLTGRLERLQAFRDTDTYKQLPENSRFLLDNQCKAMDDYQTYLKRRIQLECDNTGNVVDK